MSFNLPVKRVHIPFIQKTVENATVISADENAEKAADLKHTDLVIVQGSDSQGNDVQFSGAVQNFIFEG